MLKGVNEMGKDKKGKELGKGISQRKDGRYEARYINKYGQRKTIYSFKLNEIKRLLRNAKYEDEHGINGNGVSITLDEWFLQWMELYKSKTVKLTTQQNLRAHYNSRISKNIGNMYLKDIKTVHIQKLLMDLLDIGLNISTVHNFKIILKDMLKRAVQNEYITKNPCEGVDLPPVPTTESRVLTPKEQEIFFKFAENYVHINVLKLTLLTGMRIGEVLGLQWSDINFDERKISIDKTLHYGEGGASSRYVFFYTTSKTSSSKRVLPMSDMAYEVLKNQQDKQLKARLRNKGAWNTIDGFEDLVFLGAKGKPIKISTMNDTIKLYVEKINVFEHELAKEENREPVEFKHFTCHALRHTFTTRCYEQGVPDKVLQKLLGHANIETTLNIYTHATDEAKEYAINNVKILA